MRKKSVEWTTNGREREGTPYYILYRGGRPTPASPRVAMGIAPLKGHESIFNTFSKGPFRPGREGEGGERKTEPNAGSERRSKIYFDYAEQQGGKDREAGLKRKTTAPLRRFALVSLSQGGKGKRETEN